MKLAVHELRTELSQKITTGDKPVWVEAIRPHLYKHGSPAGALYLEVRNAQGYLIATSQPVVIADIPGLPFFHGEIDFPLETSLVANATYFVTLKGTGYSFNESAFIGWCNDFDLRKMQPSYSPSNGTRAALLLEIWERKPTKRGY